MYISHRDGGSGVGSLAQNKVDGPGVCNADKGLRTTIVGWAATDSIQYTGGVCSLTIPNSPILEIPRSVQFSNPLRYLCG